MSAVAPGGLPDFQAWVGRTETRQDLPSPAQAQAMAATLDCADLPLAAGAALPPAWHWMLFNPAVPPGELGPDGHPRRGGFLPPVPLPRRMWAGGRLVFHRPLRIGVPVSRRSIIAAVTAKQGRSGPLVFVTVQHQVADPEGVCLDETHDIVYRDAPAAGAPSVAAVAAPIEVEWSRRVVPDPVLLFRYSALTFNGHRIHYDRPYATGVEGYPGLIVHGPLIATLLLDLVRRSAPGRTLQRFAFTARSPLFDDRPFTLNGRPSGSLWAADAGGALAMEASFDLAP